LACGQVVEPPTNGLTASLGGFDRDQRCDAEPAVAGLCKTLQRGDKLHALAIANNLSYIHVMTQEVDMAIADSRTFRSGNSEAVRLPRNVAFGREVELTIVRSGDVLTIYPARKPIGDLVKQLAQLPRPLSIEERDDEVLPERPGL
jgi:antitoxin VapB